MSEITTTIVNGGAVAGAYRNSFNLQPPAGPSTDAEQAGNSFADMVREAATDAARTMREADAVARSGLADGATTQEVVQATIALESTVKVAVAMRDKLVAAYQEIMRMPI
ncbi:flagellar hook-basal body complex protein FliE [Seohaeicola zhoushanensis]|uniref:Flagellar hook-basal body complex protein FliE n=1 Tax=Seohaeicola zhoushanensis TaxID=1569283 RepID=A0A8J3M406_9RHOB|nr:flagellar hook-basal body complex protein FliE [Seohaeicola zhoushanensis]GHF36017.1 flagellar hook-basal body complex protein FliE [Seohaeicola zhoushanensis]